VNKNEIDYIHHDELAGWNGCGQVPMVVGAGERKRFLAGHNE
jgi:hypothetical protein